MGCCNGEQIYPEYLREVDPGLEQPEEEEVIVVTPIRKTTPDDIIFTVNGQTVKVGHDIPPWTRLVDYLREVLHLTGTKVLCREAGCGLCNVVVTMPDLENPEKTKAYSIQACQTLVYACAGWSIETVESLGNRYEGYHPLQTALHGFYGTQCGFCSPGMIMMMYGQLKNGPLTQSTVEKSLDGNLCRCTGYRPILDAFKSLAVDGEQALKEKLIDIEDAYKGTCNNACSKNCGDCKHLKDEIGKQREAHEFSTLQPKKALSITSSGVQWHRPTALKEVYEILKTLSQHQRARIVVGNTGQGVFKDDGPYDVYISTHGIKELYYVGARSPLVLSSNVSLARAMEIFKYMAATVEGYSHLQEVAKHWQVVANVSVRNAGCWAGNLMMKHSHREFPSDIFLTLLSCGAQVTVGHAVNGSTSTHDLVEFLDTDMYRKVVLFLTIPKSEEGEIFYRSFKITPRAVNAHAYINACFKMNLDKDDGYRVIGRPTILFGGVNPNFIHAEQTETYLEDRQLMNEQILMNAVQILGSEVNPDFHYHDASPEYRRSLCQSLLFKTIVGFLKSEVDRRIFLAGPIIERPISSGEQSYDMNEEDWPLGEPFPKLESATQISGEAQYLDDIPALPNELHAAFVLATIANATLVDVDPSEALELEGVVDFVSVKDIPGTNSFIAMTVLPTIPDPVFADEEIVYAGQPIGAIIARNRDTAVRAAKLVSVQYEEVSTPVLTIKDAMENDRVAPIIMGTFVLGDYEEAKEEAPHSIVGEVSFGSQYHLNMEAHAARVIPTEDGYDVYCTTQGHTETQIVVANVLAVPSNRVNVSVRRLGGAYGSKITRQNVVAAAAAVAARKLQRPVRMTVDLNAQMTYAGWREPYHVAYEVGFEESGKITALKVDITTDAGHASNEASVYMIAGALQNSYYFPNLVVAPYIANTHTAANTWCRTPGHVEGIGAIETIIEHVACYLEMDPLEVRKVNMAPADVPRLMCPPLEKNVVEEEILPLLIEKASYSDRKKEIDSFNKVNLWRKRGIAIIPMCYEYNYPSIFNYGVQVSIYVHDGSVAVSFGGIEMGQGINTKVAQVAAYTLGVPLDKIVIKATNTMIGANSITTGGSLGTDLCAHGTRMACSQLRDRIEVVRELMKEEQEGEEPTWENLVKKCHTEQVDLSQRYWTNANENPEGYVIWGGCCLEVDVDILTGVFVIRRADIIEDCGRSLSPYVDVGQVEGAFQMGLGFYTSELVKFNPQTGQKLSNSTWEYKPPTALDIPVELNVTLLPNEKSPKGVLSSKATGEPPLCLSYAVVAALRHAIKAFRMQNGNNEWFNMDAPITVEKVHMLCEIDPSSFKLNPPPNMIGEDDEDDEEGNGDDVEEEEGEAEEEEE